MARLIRSLRRQSVRTSITTSLDNSAASPCPDLGSDALYHSQGSSAALAELTERLGDALEHFDTEDDPKYHLNSILQQLDTEASKYRNSQIDSHRLQPWNCDAQLVKAAAACSMNAYEHSRTLLVDGITDLHKISYEPAAEIGVRRAAAFALYQPPLCEPSSSVLIVAIEGTRRKVDHVVNLNSSPDVVGSFINQAHFVGSRLWNGEPIEMAAHCGFLRSAKRLAQLIDEQMHIIVRDYGVQHVLFTGHSAGGAIASLLFAHFASINKFSGHQLRYSSITFGSPPVTTVDFSQYFLPDQSRPNNIGHVLCFANEFDLVTRTDAAYIRSLVDLYRSIYALPRLPSSGQGRKVRGQLNDRSYSEPFNNSQSGNSNWALPPPELCHIGRIVVLTAGSWALYNDTLYQLEEPSRLGHRIRAYEARPADFSTLLFCRVSVHKMKIYLENIEEIATGRINGGQTWR